MCGIGMLTLTGNTISMDVFGPVADNANGIGEMGYNKDMAGQDLKAGDPDYMPPADYKRARQILADLDAVGNTTKAITKGIAIGSAVIAAVSLFNSFIVSVGTGGGGENARITDTVYNMVASMLTISDPTLFIGMLIGGAVPFLFSSMTIRAVGRAAFLIVKECRIQFRDKEIWAGTKKPDYGRVVNICTGEAQKELIGPGLLAMLVPILVGYGLGVVALAGFLGGMIVVGQLLAVFMANAGGAWDNAKKTIEDEPEDRNHRQGQREAQGRRDRRHRRRSVKGHRRTGHQSLDQGDEHGQPADHRPDLALRQTGLPEAHQGRRDGHRRKGARHPVLGRNRHRPAGPALGRVAVEARVEA